MSTPRERIESEVRQALKAGEKERLATLRLLLNAIDNERIRAGEEVDETVFLGLVRKAIRQRHEAEEQYRRGGRQDLAEKEAREAETLKRYLPPPIDDDEIRRAVREFVSAEGISGPRAMGPVMRAMISRFGGSADAGTINRLVREVLAEDS